MPFPLLLEQGPLGFAVANAVKQLPLRDLFIMYVSAVLRDLILDAGESLWAQLRPQASTTSPADGNNKLLCLRRAAVGFVNKQSKTLPVKWMHIGLGFVINKFIVPRIFAKD